MTAVRRRVAARVVLAAAVAVAAAVTVPTPSLAATCPSPGGASVPNASAEGDVVFRGHGWGHGLGMSQYGAQGAAKLGCSYQEILTAYYKGASVTRTAMPGSVYLRMLDNGGRVDLTAESGPVTWQVATSSGVSAVATQPKGATWRLYRDGTHTKFRLNDAATGKNVWVGGGTGQTVRLSHPGTVVRMVTRRWNTRTSAYDKVYLDRRLRWDWTQFAYDGEWFDAVQVITGNGFGSGMQKYLWGIAEVPTLFPTAALKAQAVAARTYAARLGGGSLSRPLMPTPADQNYTGYSKESEDAKYDYRWKKAVDATDGEVLKDGTGKYVVTYYSSSMGGNTEDVRYVGWSSTAVGYLSAIDDSRWEMASSNPATYRSWAAGFSWDRLAAGLGFDAVSAISVAGPGTAARLQGVKVVGTRNGSSGTYYLSGWDVRQRLGLLSPGLTIRTNAPKTSFVPVAPARLYDSRTGTRKPLGPDGRLDLKVAGVGGVPASGVGAVALNVTAVRPSKSTYLTVWPAGQTRPSTSVLNAPAHTTRAAMAVTGVRGGKVSIRNAGGQTDVVVDVLGYYTTSIGSGHLFHPTQPVRLFDSRETGGKLGGGRSRTLTLPAMDGVGPASMTGAIVNVTATDADRYGYLTLAPAGTASPKTSTLNFTPSAGTVSNRAVTKLASGKLTVTAAGGPTHVVVDLVGWYAPAAVPAGDTFRAVGPSRVLDTRTGVGAPKGSLPGGGTLGLTVSGAGKPVPSGASAVVMTLTATGATSATWLTAYPTGTERPTTSDLNVQAQVTTANLVVVPIGAGGKVDLYNNNGRTHLVGDVVGYYSR